MFLICVNLLGREFHNFAPTIVADWLFIVVLVYLVLNLWLCLVVTHKLVFPIAKKVWRHTGRKELYALNIRISDLHFTISLNLSIPSFKNKSLVCSSLPLLQTTLTHLFCSTTKRLSFDLYVWPQISTAYVKYGNTNAEYKVKRADSVMQYFALYSIDNDLDTLLATLSM